MRRSLTLNLNDVELNSLYALDAECLARLAALLGMDEDRPKFSAEYEKMKRLINEKLWNERAGIYENRFWDGRFSPRLSPTNFYPLFAGVAGPDQARRMIREHLLNREEFWGPNVAPTIARNDPAFADQFYWRGDIWGPTNYMLYQGLNRYRFDGGEALDYARKSYAYSWTIGKQTITRMKTITRGAATAAAIRTILGARCCAWWPWSSILTRTRGTDCVSAR